MIQSNHIQSRILEVDEKSEEQRIDNYLIKTLKGVPRPRIYKALRKGEVRINGSRTKAPYHLKRGDKIRIPPIRHESVNLGDWILPNKFIHIPALYEDDHLLIINKPSGLAVHGGSGIKFGLIETLRKVRPELTFIELVHRLDKETSGCLMLAKSRYSLRCLHEQLSINRQVKKIYTTLVKGQWTGYQCVVNTSLCKKKSTNGHTKMIIQTSGTDKKEAISIIRPINIGSQCSLLSVEIKTGRTHQIRVHCASLGHPIAGDLLYGDDEFNRYMKRNGLKRIFLHANFLQLTHPITGKLLQIQSKLSRHLTDLVKSL